MGRRPGVLRDFGQRCCVCRCHRLVLSLSKQRTSWYPVTAAARARGQTGRPAAIASELDAAFLRHGHHPRPIRCGSEMAALPGVAPCPDGEKGKERVWKIPHSPSLACPGLLPSARCPASRRQTFALILQREFSLMKSISSSAFAKARQVTVSAPP